MRRIRIPAILTIAVGLLTVTFAGVVAQSDAESTYPVEFTGRIAGGS